MVLGQVTRPNMLPFEVGLTLLSVYGAEGEPLKVTMHSAYPVFRIPERDHNCRSILYMILGHRSIAK